MRSVMYFGWSVRRMFAGISSTCCEGTRTMVWVVLRAMLVCGAVLHGERGGSERGILTNTEATSMMALGLGLHKRFARYPEGLGCREGADGHYYPANRA